MAPYWAPKIGEQSLNFEKMEVPRRPLKRLCAGIDFWMDFGGLRVGFRLVLGASGRRFLAPGGRISTILCPKGEDKGATMEDEGLCFATAIAFGETCAKHLVLKDLL